MYVRVIKSDDQRTIIIVIIIFISYMEVNNQDNYTIVRDRILFKIIIIIIITTRLPSAIDVAVPQRVKLNVKKIALYRPTTIVSPGDVDDAIRQWGAGGTGKGRRERSFARSRTRTKATNECIIKNTQNDNGEHYFGDERAKSGSVCSDLAWVERHRKINVNGMFRQT